MFTVWSSISRFLVVLSKCLTINQFFSENCADYKQNDGGKQDKELPRISDVNRDDDTHHHLNFRDEDVGD